MRVVIPRPLQARVLDELHVGHPGIVRMKAQARVHVWWPGLDTNIANTVRGCLSCQSGAQWASTSTLATLVLAKGTMGENSCRFRRSVHE